MIKFVMTCGACPEQYDAFDYDTGERVGYLRLRYGCFTVTCPDLDGETVYSTETEGDGAFNENERDDHLAAAAFYIEAWKNGKKPDKPRADYIVIGRSHD